MSRYFQARIKENLQLNKNHNLLSLIIPENAKASLPGQFYMLGAGNGYDPLLKRAFSLFRRTPDGIQILFRIKGKGTLLLSRMEKGEYVDVLGPLGNHYPVAASNKTPVVIAGGIGIASVFSLIESLQGKAYVFYGVRTKDELFMLDELKGLSRELFITTDDGSFGEKGVIVTLLNDFLNRNPEIRDRSLIYACGPMVMLRETSRIAISNNIRAYVSLEENMACGIGACLGCAVRCKGQGAKGRERISNGKLTAEIIYKKVCKDGPVFRADEIQW